MVHFLAMSRENNQVQRQSPTPMEIGPTYPQELEMVATQAANILKARMQRVWACFCTVMQTVRPEDDIAFRASCEQLLISSHPLLEAVKQSNNSVLIRNVQDLITQIYINAAYSTFHAATHYETSMRFCTWTLGTRLPAADEAKYWDLYKREHARLSLLQVEAPILTTTLGILRSRI